MNEKDARLAEFCRDSGVEGVLIRRRSNAAWVTDGGDFHCDTASQLGVATLLWTPARKTIFTDNIEAPRLKAEEPLAGWDVAAAPWWEPAAPPTGRYASDTPDDVLAPLRFSLTPRELERVRALGAESSEEVERTAQAAQVGWSEHEAAAHLAGGLRRRGIFAQVLLVAADERISRYRHPIPTKQRVEKTLMLVLCAQRYGLIVCLTRLVHFGPIPAELRRRHEAVCRVDAALHAATQPGTRWCDALAAGIRAYEDAGFGDEWQKHHQGGPMGYEARDFKATPTEMRTVQPNQLVGWNPSITGTKSEDTIVAGGENVTAARDWPMCGGRPAILER